MKCQNCQFTKFISLLKFPGLQYVHTTCISADVAWLTHKFIQTTTGQPYAEEHQAEISMGNKNISSLRFWRNKNIDLR